MAGCLIEQRDEWAVKMPRYHSLPAFALRWRFHPLGGNAPRGGLDDLHGWQIFTKRMEAEAAIKELVRRDGHYRGHLVPVRVRITIEEI